MLLNSFNLFFIFILLESVVAAEFKFTNFAVKDKFEPLAIEEKFEEAITNLLSFEEQYIANKAWEDLVFLYVEIGYFNLYLSNKNEAEKYYQKASSIVSDKNIKWRHELKIYVAAKWLEFYIAYHDNSKLLKYKKVLSKYIQEGNINYDLASEAYNMLGKVYNNDTYHMDSSAYFFELALHAVKNSSTSSVFRIANQEYFYAHSLFKLGKIKKAALHFTSILKKYKKIGFIAGAVNCYQYLAVIYWRSHNYDRALAYFKYAENLEIKYPIIKANLYRLIGNINSELNDLVIAKQYINKSIAIYQSLNAEDNLHNYYILYAYAELGKLYEKLNMYDSAMYFYNESYTIRLQLFGENSHELIANYIDYARINKDSSNENKLRYLNKALKIAISTFGRNHSKTSECYSLLAKAHTRTNPLQGLEYIQKAIISAINGFSNPSWQVNPPLSNSTQQILLLNCLMIKADLISNFYLQKTHQLEELKLALETYKLAVRLADTIRYSYHSEGSQIKLTNITTGLYKASIQCAIRLYKITNKEKYKYLAFEIAEKSKASVLLGFIQREEAKTLALPQYILNKEQDLKGELNYYISQVEKLESKLDRSIKENQILMQLKQREFELREQLDHFLAKIENNYPKYYHIKYNLSIVKVNELQQNLADNQKLISYFEGDSLLFIFLIGNNNYELKAIPKDSTYWDQIHALQKSISSSSFIINAEQNWKSYTEHAQGLYKLLIQPIKSHFQEKDHLIIIPDGIMALVPFEAMLVSKPTKTLKYDMLDYLVYHYTISYANSATLWLKSQQEQREVPTNELLAFAPSFEPMPAKNGAELGRGYEEKVQDTIRGNLMPLIWTDKELEYISSYFNSQLLFGNDATEKRFKSESPKYKILHIATHANVQDNRPMFSRIYFTDDGDSIEDAALHTFELYNIPLNAELAVLSACNTGYGQTIQGEGVLNLARGFTYAGCQSIVMSLWNANDRTTAELMKHFYKYLSKGENKGVALNLAKLDFLKEADAIKSHPYFWAQFVASGDMRPVAERSHWWVWVVSFSIVLIATAVIWRLRLSRKKLR